MFVEEIRDVVELLNDGKLILFDLGCFYALWVKGYGEKLNQGGGWRKKFWFRSGTMWLMKL